MKSLWREYQGRAHNGSVHTIFTGRAPSPLHVADDSRPRLHACSRMVFEKDKINITPYEIPYGELMVGIYTTQLDVEVQERQIDVYVRYSLDVNGEKFAECNIRMKVEAKDGMEAGYSN